MRRLASLIVLSMTTCILVTAVTPRLEANPFFPQGDIRLPDLQRKEITVDGRPVFAVAEQLESSGRAQEIQKKVDHMSKLVFGGTTYSLHRENGYLWARVGPSVVDPLLTVTEGDLSIRGLSIAPQRLQASTESFLKEVQHKLKAAYQKGLRERSRTYRVQQLTYTFYLVGADALLLILVSRVKFIRKRLLEPVFWFICSLLIGIGVILVTGLFPETRSIFAFGQHTLPVLMLALLLSIIFCWLMRRSRLWRDNLHQILFPDNSELSRRRRRIYTVASVARSALLWGFGVLSCLLIIYLLFDLTGALAALALGTFVAQRGEILNDVLTTALIVIQDLYVIGDILIVGHNGKDQRMEVIGVGLVHTQLITLEDGIVHIYSSSRFRNIIARLSQENDIIRIDERLNLPLDAPRQKVEDIVITVLNDLHERYSDYIVSVQTLRGIQEVTAQGYTVRAVITVTTKNRDYRPAYLEIERLFREQTFLMLKEQGIPVPSPRYSLILDNFSEGS